MTDKADVEMLGQVGVSCEKLVCVLDKRVLISDALCIYRDKSCLTCCKYQLASLHHINRVLKMYYVTFSFIFLKKIKL